MERGTARRYERIGRGRMRDSTFQKCLAAGAVIPLLLFLNVLPWVTTANADSPPQGSQEFHARLDSLQQSERSDADPVLIIAGYRQLITESGDHPDIADAMHALGRFCRSAADRHPQSPEYRDAAIEWFRRAVEASRESTLVWYRARIDLAGQLRWKRDDDDAVREARAIIEAMAAKYPDQAVTQVRVKSELVAQCLAEENYIAAERHCREVLDWPKFSGDTPASVIEQRILETHQAGSAMYLVQRQIHGPGTKKGKTAWLEQFVRGYSDRPWCPETVKRARERIAALDDPPPSIASLPLLASNRRTVRTVFLVCNLVVVLVLGVLVLWNRYIRRQVAT
jgi:hypothetical protein